jgi:hypothetical protein
MSAREQASGPWHAHAAARPLVAWSDNQLGVLGRTVDRALAGWAADWGLRAPWTAPVRCGAPAQAEGSAWEWLAGAGETASWTCSGKSAAQELTRALFAGAADATPLLLEIGQACWDDALGRVRAMLPLSAADGAPAEPGAWALAPWGGSALVDLPAGARLLLQAAVVRACVDAAGPAPQAATPVRSGPATVPVERALAASALQLQVQLDGCELDVGSLQDLQVGDVLRLRHALDAPAAVSLADGVPLFTGFLARSRGRKAVEIAQAIA